MNSDIVINRLPELLFLELINIHGLLQKCDNGVARQDPGQKADEEGKEEVKDAPG